MKKLRNILNIRKTRVLEIALLAYDIYHLTEEEKLKTLRKKKLDDEVLIALKEENVRDSKLLKFKQEEDELQKRDNLLFRMN